MQIVELKVQVEKSQLAALEAQVKALDGKSINIKVNTSGLQKLDNQTLKTLNTLTKYETAQAKLTTAQSKNSIALARQAEATARVNVAREKTTQTTNRLATEEARYRTQTERTRTEQARLQTQIERTRTAQERATGTAKSYGTAAKENSKLNQLLGGSIGEVAAKMAAWQVMGAAVSVPIKAMREALSTMKEVDTQLVDIRKVTDFNKQQMAEIEEQSYKTASAYGVAADQYLASVAAFARAGYKEQSNDLAELSVKTQLVGNTTADVANQFLLSTDAAYNYHGSIQELSKVLDGANEIDNNYATSIEKIAEGMGIVAPVAAQAHVGVDELMASLGTITAVTQRSGSEAARALRALFLNIIGDTKTEIDEGVTWTTGEIAGLQDVLRKFAPDVVKTADAMGTVINPMEAMHALSQAMKDDVLNEQELMEMVSDIGGKLRTSQLLAIIENWDMYESMLDDFKNAAGSAEEEVENAMDSWERKSEILKNTWTKFVSDMVNTDMIKGGLDGVTKVIDLLDSDLGQAAIKAGGLALAFTGVSKAVTGISAAIKGSQFVNFIASFAEVFAGQGLLAALSQTAALIGPIGIAIAAIAATVAGVKLYDFFNVDYDEQVDKVKELKGEYEQLFGKEGELQSLEAKQKSGEGLSEWEQSRLQYLRDYNKELDDRIEKEKKILSEKYQQEYGSESKYDDKSKLGSLHERMETAEPKDVSILREAKQAYDDLTDSVKNGKISREDAKSQMEELLSTYQDFYDMASAAVELGDLDLSDPANKATADMMRLYDTMKALSDLPIEEWDIGSAIMQFDKLAEVGDKSVYNLQAFKQALADAGASAEDIEGTIAQLQSDDNVILIDVEAENIEETISSLKELGIATEEAGQTKVNVDEFAKLADNLGMSKEEATGLATEMEKAGAELVDAEGNAANLEAAFSNVGSPLQNLTDSVSDLVATIREAAGLPPLEVTADTSQAEGALDSVENKKDTFEQPANSELSVTDNASQPIMTAEAEATRFGGMRPRPTISVTDNASSVLGKIIGLISSIKNKTVTITTNHVNSYTGTDTKDYHGHATGALNFRGGPTLLGDELSSDGSPRPELVITRSGAFIAGMGGPVMASLPAGSRIYKYSDTMDILSGGDIEQLQAFSAGNDRALNAWRNRGSVPASSPSSSSSPSGSASKPSSANRSSNSSRSSGSRSSGSSGRASNSNGRSGGVSSGNASNIDALKDELELLEAQYQFLEASDASADDLIAKSQEIQSHLHTINERLRATGGAEKDIVGYSTEWWKELDKIWEVQKKIFEDARNLYQSELDLMRANSTDDEERIEKLYAILENLHEEAEFLRSIDADQEAINQLSVEWWKTQEDIYSVMEDQRSLMESQVTLIEHQKAPAQERIAIMRREQENLHQQAEYMRSIGARQEDINRLSIQWWEIQEKILDTQQKLVDELNAAVNLELRRAMRARDLAIKRIDEEIKKEQEKRDLKKEQVDLSERELEVKKAQIALDNTLRERTVRYYNAATGQWERGADANAVRSAREALEEARKSKKEYDEENEFNLRIKELESQKDQINQNYQDLENRWDLLMESFEDPLRDIKEILADLLATGKLTDEQVALVKSLVGDISSYTSQILQFLPYLKYTQANPGATIQEYLEAFTGGAVDTSGFSQSFLDWLQKNPDAEWVYTDGNGNAFYSNGTASTESPFNTPGGVNFLHPSDAVSSVTEYNSSTSSTSGMPGSAVSAFVSALENTAKGETRTTVTGGGSSGGGSYRPIKTSQQKSKSGLYDSGGVLSGVGGIKATAEDEIVIPPDVARAMLAPSADNTFRRRMSELGYLYGASSKPPASIIGNTNSRTSSDHYGDLYQFGNVIMTEGQARSTSVYDLARMSRSLGIYKNG